MERPNTNIQAHKDRRCMFPFLFACMELWYFFVDQIFVFVGQIGALLRKSRYLFLISQ